MVGRGWLHTVRPQPAADVRRAKREDTCPRVASWPDRLPLELLKPQGVSWGVTLHSVSCRRAHCVVPPSAYHLTTAPHFFKRAFGAALLPLHLVQLQRQPTCHVVPVVCAVSQVSREPGRPYYCPRLGQPTHRRQAQRLLLPTPCGVHQSFLPWLVSASLATTVLVAHNR